MTRFFRWSLRAYRSLLTLYPEDLRREFGTEVLEAFEDDLSAECAVHSIRGIIRVWRIALRETIQIALPAWRRNPALAVSAISTAIALVTQSPLLILAIRRAARLNLRPGDATLLDTLFALALGAALTALTSFVAVHRWKRGRLIIIECMVIVALLSPVAHAQTPSATPTFEVAVIKPSLPMADALPLLREGKLKVGMSIDKARVEMGFVTLTDLIVEAYKVKPHQISGPDWLLMERFDIQAKLPDGSVEGEVPQMLRAMLADRFGLSTHRESRALSAYALVVGKNGAKLQPSTLPPDPEPAKGLPTVKPSGGSTVTSSGGPAGPTQITMGPDGVQLVMLKTKISGLADLLTSILGKPVVDRTGLTGDYKITLDIPQSDVANVARALGMGGPATTIGGPTDPGGGSMFQAVEQFGLRLDSRKEEIETLVVDHIEKLPTAN